MVADTALFGQPEIKLGVIPGIGGSQRLTRAVGKAKAMETCLTGRTMDATEAERAGLVSRVVPADDLLEEARTVAETIAGMSLPVAMMAKEAVSRAFETTWRRGCASNAASSAPCSRLRTEGGHDVLHRQKNAGLPSRVTYGSVRNGAGVPTPPQTPTPPPNVGGVGLTVSCDGGYG